MASTYSDLLRLEKMATGEKNNTWGTVANANVFEMIEDAIAGYVAVNCAGSADVTLTASNATTDQSRMAIVKCTGLLTGDIDVIIPATSKHYIIWNATTGSFTLTLKTSGGTGALITQGSKVVAFCDGTDTYNLATNFKETGKETIWIPAVAMSPATTSGASQSQVEISAGAPEPRVLDFDSSTAEYALFEIAMPKSWNEGTLTYQAFWLANSTSTNSVTWKLQAVAVSDGDAYAASFGTAIAVSDANGSTANLLRVTSESSAMTAGGTPAAGDVVAFRMSRDPTDGSDTLAVDARLVGIKLFFTTDAGNDA